MSTSLFASVSSRSSSPSTVRHLSTSAEEEGDGRSSLTLSFDGSRALTPQPVAAASTSSMGGTLRESTAEGEEGERGGVRSSEKESESGSGSGSTEYGGEEVSVAMMASGILPSMSVRGGEGSSVSESVLFSVDESELGTNESVSTKDVAVISADMKNEEERERNRGE
mmetsp:Transcript_36384/g.94642  ORF Transcript_36384/g.94642 Transcript_36384/m.94642 type:complete len:168 (-) Transcript_36384:8-511(-)